MSDIELLALRRNQMDDFRSKVLLAAFIKAHAVNTGDITSDATIAEILGGVHYMTRNEGTIPPQVLDILADYVRNGGQW
jgi:hypothetical protein